MKSRTIKILRAALCTAVATLASCSSSTDIEASIRAAEAEVAIGNYTAAVDMCNDLWQSADTASFSAVQLCRMALVYAGAADNDVDNDSNMGAAARCFDKAYKSNPDSTMKYVENLPVAEQSAARMMMQLMHGRDIDHSKIIDEHDVDGLDSIPYAHEH